jgi:hypothetical protein
VVPQKQDKRKTRPKRDVEEVSVLFEEAVKAEIDRVVARLFARKNSHATPEAAAQARRRVRAVVELKEMISDIRAELAVNKPRGPISCPWTFELLRLLDDPLSHDLSIVEPDGHRAVGRSLDEVRDDIHGDVVRHRERTQRIGAMLEDHDPSIHRPREELEATAIDEQATIAALKAIAKIQPDRNYLKSAALRILMHLRGENARELAAFIDSTHDNNPSPCSQFSPDDCYDRVRAILSRSS